MDAAHGGVPPTAPARQGEVRQSFDGRGLERPLMRPVETPLQSLQDDREALGPPHADADGRVDDMRHVDGDVLVQPERRPRIPRPRARKPLDIDEPFVDGRRLLYSVFQNNPTQIKSRDAGTEQTPCRQTRYSTTQTKSIQKKTRKANKLDTIPFN